MKEAILAKETTTTTGTGTLSLDGAASGYRTFLSAGQIATGDWVRYLLKASDGSGWEDGIGQITTGTPATLTRHTVLESSNADALISLPAGTHEVGCASAPNILSHDFSMERSLASNFSMTAYGVWDMPLATEVANNGWTYDSGTGLFTPPPWADVVQFHARTYLTSGTSGNWGSVIINTNLSTSLHLARESFVFGTNGQAYVSVVTPPLRGVTWAALQIDELSGGTFTIDASRTLLRGLAVG